MAVSHWSSKESSSYSVQKDRCLGSPNLARKAGRIPEELLVISQHGEPILEAGSDISEVGLLD